MRNGRRLSFAILITAAVLLAVGPAMGQAQKAPSANPKKVVEGLTLEDVRSVLGTPGDDASGVSDFSEAEGGGIVIAYRYYDLDEDNYETDFASEMAPKLQRLYKKFKNVDRLRFEIVANNPGGTPFWKPFSQFETDRKTLEKLHWTWFVTRDIVDQIIKNRK
ncbi:MAG TPA: hypothetical protein VLJ16_11845 [Acidobacteriota bacterium]|nr:hypothetical protein [Acidobacteriota bacterium]